MENGFLTIRIVHPGDKSDPSGFESDGNAYVNSYLMAQGGDRLKQVIAHELGHAALGFADLYPDAGRTDHLLYDDEQKLMHSAGERLRKYQWDKIHRTGQK
ncbi:MAG: hypothetical protein KGZ25_12660 [Planctomycetes bacterium]|nr:hypothetical protein [Planctomycetota bacterium]